MTQTLLKRKFAFVLIYNMHCGLWSTIHLTIRDTFTVLGLLVKGSMVLWLPAVRRMLQCNFDVIVTQLLTQLILAFALGSPRGSGPYQLRIFILESV